MRWFNRPKPKEIWEEPIAGPIGDIEAAHLIRDICHSAADSAAKTGSLAGNRDASKQQYEVQRYEGAARAAMEIAMKIGDDLLRDSAVRWYRRTTRPRPPWYPAWTWSAAPACGR